MRRRWWKKEMMREEDDERRKKWKKKWWEKQMMREENDERRNGERTKKLREHKKQRKQLEEKNKETLKKEMRENEKEGNKEWEEQIMEQKSWIKETMGRKLHQKTIMWKQHFFKGWEEKMVKHMSRKRREWHYNKKWTAKTCKNKKGNITNKTWWCNTWRDTWNKWPWLGLFGIHQKNKPYIRPTAQSFPE